MQLVSAWHDTSWIELIAAALAVAYLLLAIGQRLSCWLAAFLSSVLYVWVLFSARLYMESVLNAFYAAMAVYGFWQWQHGKGGGQCLRHILGGPQGIRELALVAADRFGQRVPVLHATLVRDDAALWAVPDLDRDRHARVAPQFAVDRQCSCLKSNACAMRSCRGREAWILRRLAQG